MVPDIRQPKRDVKTTTTIHAFVLALYVRCAHARNNRIHCLDCTLCILYQRLCHALRSAGAHLLRAAEFAPLPHALLRCSLLSRCALRSCASLIKRTTNWAYCRPLSCHNMGYMLMEVKTGNLFNSF